MFGQRPQTSPLSFAVVLMLFLGLGTLLSVNGEMRDVRADGDSVIAQGGFATEAATEPADTVPDATLIFVTLLPLNTATRTPTPVNIGNFVWEDRNGNGIQNAGEPGLAGITVQVWNSAKTALLGQTVTNASGAYTLTVSGPGNYRIRALLTGSDTFTVMNAGSDNQLDSDINPSGANMGFTDAFNIASNVISTTIYDIGIVKQYTPTPTRTPTPVNIGNFVWDDRNGNGIQNVGEPGIGGITVQVWNAARTALLDQTVTNANGGYTVTVSGPGDYRIRAVLTGSDTFTIMNAGSDDQLDSDINPSGLNMGFTNAFNIASNVISTTIYDIGIIRQYTPTPTRTPTPINIGDFVWNDLNGNGIQNVGEPGIGGVTMQLWNAEKTVMLYQTLSSANGSYTVVAPIPGNYRVRAVLNGLDTFTSMNAGDDLLDSDINPSGPDAGFTDIFNIASNVISTVIYDVGVIKSAAPSGYDSLALYGRTENKFSLIPNTVDKPLATTFTTYASNGVTGKFVMGDWNSDGQKTPGIYKGGYFRYTNDISANATWASVWIGKYKKISVVSGRFKPSLSNDCVGVVHLKHGTGVPGFPIYYVCDLVNGGVEQVWLNAEIAETGKYQVIAGDFNNDGVDTLAVRRGNIFMWTDAMLGSVSPASFANTMNFGDPHEGYGIAVAGDWDGDGYDTFGLYFLYNKQSRFFWHNVLVSTSQPPFLQRFKNKVGESPQVDSWHAPGAPRGSDEQNELLPLPAPLSEDSFNVTATATSSYIESAYGTLTPTPTYMPTEAP